MLLRPIRGSTILGDTIGGGRGKKISLVHGETLSKGWCGNSCPCELRDGGAKLSWAVERRKQRHEEEEKKRGVKEKGGLS